MKLNLKDLVVNATEAQFEFPLCPGMKVTIAYTNKVLLNNIRTSAMIQKFDKETGQPYQDLDTEKYLDNYIKAVVKGWSGFTVEHLNDMVLIDKTDLDMDKEIDFDHDTAVFLMNEASAFDTWVVTTAKQLENFRKQK
jgi:hypothetical protein